MLGLVLFCSQAGAVDDPSLNHQFPASLQKRARELTIPGVAFAVVRDGQVVFKNQINTDPQALLSRSTRRSGSLPSPRR